MIDIAIIREAPETIKSQIATMGLEVPIDEIVRLDSLRRDLIHSSEALKATRNSVSKEIATMSDKSSRAAKIDEMRKVSDEITALDTRLTVVEKELHDLMMEVPNVPHPDLPVGADEEENRVVKTVGEIPTYDFEVVPHWDIGPAAGIIDFDRGVKISGSRFYILMGDGARLQRALISWMLDLHTNEHGYTEVYPPALVHGFCLEGTGQLPKFVDNLYKDHEEDLWLVPTAEVPVTNMFRDEIMDFSQLPGYYTAYTPCFRREKMSAGKDVRGIKRGHQFDKVEMVKFVEPETSGEELMSLLDNSEDVCRKLGLTYRILEICTGDLGFSASRTYDVEVWAPGCQEWLEVSSCSDFGDFQARRANIRYRSSKTDKPRFVHTLNGSGLALPRTMIAIMESYQARDGSIAIPEVLQPYMGGQTTIAARK